MQDGADVEEPAKPPVRENIQAKDEYLRDFGGAAYNFAYVVWGIV